MAVQEVDRDQGRSHQADQARLLGEALGMEWRYAPALLGTPGSSEGWRVPVPGDPDPGGTAYGIALLSRLPLDQVETVALPQSGRDEPRVGLVAGLADGGRRLTVAGTHLSFVPGPNVGQLRALQRHLDERGGPRLLLGDLNLWWPAVRLLSLPGWRPLVRGGTFRNRPPGSPAPLVQLDHVLAAGAERRPGAQGQPDRQRPRLRPQSGGGRAGVALTWAAEAPSLVPLSRGQLATARPPAPARAARADDRPAPARHRQRQLPGRPLAGPAGAGGGDRRQLDPGRRPGRARPGRLRGQVAGFVEAPAAFEPLLRRPSASCTSGRG